MSRHAKPTSRQLAERTYRKVVALEKTVKSLAPVIEHCRRLVNEKEILRERLAVYEANQFMARSAPRESL